MEWTDIQITVPQQYAETAEAIATMVSNGGIYIEDYRDLEQQAWEIAHVDLIEQDLLDQPRDIVKVHMYLAPDENPAEILPLFKERLEAIYAKYGRYLNKVDSFEFPGLSGMDKMASIMDGLRKAPPAEIGGYKVTKVTDYEKNQETGLPAANVLIYSLEGGATVVVRPSGTEPKIKTYFTTLGKDLAQAQAQKDKLAEALKPILA